SPGWAGVSVQLTPFTSRLPVVNRTRLDPLFTLAMVACARPVPKPLIVVTPKLRATMLTVCGSLVRPLEVTRTAYSPAAIENGTNPTTWLADADLIKASTELPPPAGVKLMDAPPSDFG